MRKTNPLTKLRFKPQVSAAFASVSILIDANGVDPDWLPNPQKPELEKRVVELLPNGYGLSIDGDGLC
jgi:hypothetical protein